jgi:WhiB family redox-sensing transcriptional regulator
MTAPDHWKLDGLCRQTDPDLFYPEKGGDSSATAKRVCGACPVLEQCRTYALTNREVHGVWDGLTVLDRKTIWRTHRTHITKEAA